MLADSSNLIRGFPGKLSVIITSCGSSIWGYDTHMKLIQTFDQAIHGFWDGGPKSRFEWIIEGTPKQDFKGKYIVCIGSFEANFWFHVSAGKTERRTLGNAERYLRKKIKKDCSFEIV